MPRAAPGRPMNDPDPPDRPPPTRAGTRLGPRDLMLLAAACGLAAGELEVAARVGHRLLSPTNRLYLMTRHFVWLAPLVDLALFVALGAALAAAARRWRRARWWAPRLLVALAVLPGLALAGRRVYIEAWALVALGVASRLVPVLERDP